MSRALCSGGGSLCATGTYVIPSVPAGAAGGGGGCPWGLYADARTSRAREHAPPRRHRRPRGARPIVGRARAICTRHTGVDGSSASDGETCIVQGAYNSTTTQLLEKLDGGRNGALPAYQSERRSRPTRSRFRPPARTRRGPGGQRRLDQLERRFGHVLRRPALSQVGCGRTSSSERDDDHRDRERSRRPFHQRPRRRPQRHERDGHDQRDRGPGHGQLPRRGLQRPLPPTAPAGGTMRNSNISTSGDDADGVTGAGGTTTSHRRVDHDVGREFQWPHIGCRRDDHNDGRLGRHQRGWRRSAWVPSAAAASLYQGRRLLRRATHRRAWRCLGPALAHRLQPHRHDERDDRPAEGDHATRS